MVLEDDPIGHELMDYYLKKPSFEVFERDDGFVAAVIGAYQYFSAYKDWNRHEKAAIKYISGGTCLDIGCGAGRVALYLQSKGRNVTAIDSSALAIKVCKLRGVRNARVMRIEELDKFRKGQFNNILLFGNGFALLQNKKKAKKILKTLYRITGNKGIIITENRDPYITENPVHFTYISNNKRRGRMPGQLHQRVRFLQYVSPWYDVLYTSKSEMKKVLLGTGWKITRFLNSPNFGRDGEFFAIIEKE